MGGLSRKCTRPYGSSFSSISMAMEEKFPMTPEEFPYGNKVKVNCSFNCKRTQTITVTVVLKIMLNLTDLNNVVFLLF